MKHEASNKKHHGIVVNLFDHIDTDIIGVNGQPFVNMEQHVDMGAADQLHTETVLAFSQLEKFDSCKVSGQAPPSLVGADFLPYEDHYFASLDVTSSEFKLLKDLSKKERRRYLFFSGKITVPWYFVLFLRTNDFYRKSFQTQDYKDWEPVTKLFPKLKNWLSQLPFDEIGRVVFLATYPGVSVPPHRDWIVEDHNDHSINFMFDGYRPAYVYDCKQQEKTYLDSDCRAYFFNNRDYHGVDSESRFRYTLRVDGQFTRELQNKLNLGDGFIRCPG